MGPLSCGLQAATKGAMYEPALCVCVCASWALVHQVHLWGPGVWALCMSLGSMCHACTHQLCVRVGVLVHQVHLVALYHHSCVGRANAASTNDADRLVL